MLEPNNTIKTLYTTKASLKGEKQESACIGEKQQQTEEDTGLVYSFLRRGDTFQGRNFMSQNWAFCFGEWAQGPEIRTCRVFCRWKMAVRGSQGRGLATCVGIKHFTFIKSLIIL